MNVLAEKVIEATGSTSSVRHLTYDEAYGRGFEDMQRRVPDISKARQWFGYTPTQSLNDIVKSVVAYCRLHSRPADRHVSELSTLKVGRTTEALSA
jgi:nucleoside-diphosphate-sugar epimerase